MRIQTDSRLDSTRGIRREEADRFVPENLRILQILNRKSMRVFTRRIAGATRIPHLFCGLPDSRPEVGSPSRGVEVAQQRLRAIRAVLHHAARIPAHF